MNKNRDKPLHSSGYALVIVMLNSTQIQEAIITVIDILLRESRNLIFNPSDQGLGRNIKTIHEEEIKNAKTYFPYIIVGRAFYLIRKGRTMNACCKLSVDLRSSIFYSSMSNVAYIIRYRPLCILKDDSMDSALIYHRFSFMNEVIEFSY